MSKCVINGTDVVGLNKTITFNTGDSDIASRFVLNSICLGLLFFSFLFY